MQRVLTAVVGIPLAMAAIFLLPPTWFFLLVLLLFEWAAAEYVRIQRSRTGTAPLGVLLVLVPVVALLARSDLFLGDARPEAWVMVLTIGTLLTVGLGIVVLAAGAPVEESSAALGVVGFGVVYLVVPAVSFSRLHEAGEEYLILLLFVVWASDSAAYYVGSQFGRHRLAPVVSPKKSWEGVAGALAAAGLVGGAWVLWGRGEGWEWIALAVVAAAAGIVGDLVESLLKRAGRVKDSGHSLPGHGGILDRIDGLLFAAPIWLLGLYWLGLLP